MNLKAAKSIYHQSINVEVDSQRKISIAGATPNQSSETQQFKPKITRIKRLISASLNRIILKLRTQAMR